MNEWLRASIGFGVLWGILLSLVLFSQDAAPVAMGFILGLLLWATVELMLSYERLARLEQEIVEIKLKIETLKEATGDAGESAENIIIALKNEGL